MWVPFPSNQCSTFCIKYANECKMPIVDGLQATRIIRSIEQAKANDTSLASSPAVVSPSWLRDSPDVGSDWQSVPKSPTRSTIQPNLAPFSPSSRQRSRSAQRSGSDSCYFPEPVRPTLKRSFTLHNLHSISPAQTFNTRPPAIPHIPIFAVSANLDQHSQDGLKAVGFDGWLPKPIDFTRLGVILRGPGCSVARAEGVCTPGGCKQGGWFV
jgi:CheY-like chemotaxis protein